MNTARSAPKYDLFKLIVTLVLLALLIYLLLQFNGRTPVIEPSAVDGTTAAEQANVGIPTSTPLPAQAASATPAATNAAVQATTAAATLTPTQQQPTTTVTPAATATATQPPAATATSAPAATATAQSPTATEAAAATSTPAATEAAPVATPQPSPTPATAQGGDSAACAALPSRLQVGDRAQVLTSLYMRSDPQIAAGNVLRTHPSGTVLEIIGGPQCVPYANSAYLWWQVRNPEGQTGWSAEGSVSGRSYFLQPAP